MGWSASSPASTASLSVDTAPAISHQVLVRAFVGTSGFAYDFWKGDLYPEKIAKADMLEVYARQFHTVEINATYYRIPRAEVVQRWADAVPEGFRFVIKASRRVTHYARLRDCMDTVEYTLRQIESLGDKLGPMLFLLPAGLKRDDALLRSFLEQLPAPIRPVFEFRHASWFDDAVYDLLQGANAAMCIGEYGGERSRTLPGGRTPLRATADFGYLRLRDEAYDDATLLDWGAEAVARWDEVYAFFSHEEAAPDHVRRLNRLLGVPPGAGRTSR